MIVEKADDFNSKDYKGYKPYSPPPRNYDWKDYHKWTESKGIKLEMIKGTCHHCDIRKHSCMDHNLPRYYCKKDKVDRQSSLFEF